MDLSRYAKFWHLWTKLHIDKVKWSAVLASLPDIVILLMMISIDATLKHSATKSELKLNYSISKELTMTGVQNLLVSACVGAPGYSQVKFNLLNYGIIHNTENRLPGIGIGIFCGIMFFGGFPLINVLPRFLIGGLLLYGAMPFIENHLVLVKKRVSLPDFIAIWVIVLTNAILGIWHSFSLLAAVGVGCVLCMILFAVQYAKTNIVRLVVTGKEVQSGVVRNHAEQRLMEHVGERILIMELSGFIFFGTGR